MTFVQHTKGGDRVVTERRNRRISLLAAFAALALPGAAHSAEGALSHYLPGTAGDFGLALPPGPGFQAVNMIFVQSGSVDTAVLQGAVNVGLDVNLVLDLIGGFYTFDQKILGATYSVGGLLPFGNAELEATLTGPLGGSVRVDDSSFNLSDAAIVPLQLNWSTGNFHFKFAETIIAPTGAYDTDEIVNLGRNYWSFDTVGAVTWFDPEIGTEVSVQPGIMINSENTDTDYRTGTEFHLDFTANQFLAPTFALGLRGYWYQQVSGDSGSGAILGDFKSESVGIGPGFLWTPGFADGALAITGKAMFDVHADNRFDSNYGLLTLAWKF